MKIKPLSFILTGALALTSAAALAGCGNEDYPVSVGNLTVKSQPGKIVVLDDAAADIIDYIDYSKYLVGRSDEVDQEWLSIVPSVGSSAEPNIDEIVNSEADIVFAALDTDETVKRELTDKGITVVTMSEAQSQSSLETNYRTIGRLLGGEITGVSKANQQYAVLLNDMEKIKNTAEDAQSSDVPLKVCYLYSENNQLKMMTSGTYCDMLLSYTGAVNIAVNVTDNTVEVSTLKVADPDYIFYDSDETLANIVGNDVLKNMNAVKKKHMMLLSGGDISRQGQTALNTLQKIVEFMYPSIASESKNSTAAVESKTESTTAPSADSQKTTSAKNATEPSTAAQTETQAATDSAKSVADDYGIKIDDKKTLSYEDENKDVKAMQQRLFDLGYIDDKENITGYYGDVTKAAVRQFQKNSGIKESDNANNATLKAMFQSNAAKAE